AKGRFQAHSGAGKEPTKQIVHDWIIIDSQYRTTLEFGEICSLCFHGFQLLLIVTYGYGKLYRESAALTELTFNHNVAAHHLTKMTTKGQAKTRTAIFSGNRGVRLAERDE